MTTEKKGKKSKKTTAKKTTAKKGAAKKGVAKKSKPAKKSKTDKKSKKGMAGTHPPHPRCPECDKAMYKTMIKGKPVAKEDPWAFCRNPDCELYGKDQDGGASDENKGDGTPKPKAKKDKTEKSGKKVEKGKGKPAKKAKTDKKSKKGDKTEAIKKALLKGKMTNAEIAEKFEVKRKVVRTVRNQLVDEGKLD